MNLCSIFFYYFLHMKYLKNFSVFLLQHRIKTFSNLCSYLNIVIIFTLVGIVNLKLCLNYCFHNLNIHIFLSNNDALQYFLRSRSTFRLTNNSKKVINFKTIFLHCIFQAYYVNLIDTLNLLSLFLQYSLTKFTTTWSYFLLNPDFQILLHSSKILFCVHKFQLNFF